MPPCRPPRPGPSGRCRRTPGERWATDALAVEDTDLLWASTDGVSVGTSEAEVLGQGASSAVPGPALNVLVRAVAAQSGRLELVDGAAVLEQGVGALLRFDVRPRTPGADATGGPSPCRR